MQRPGLEREVVDADVYERTVRRFAEARIVMPTFAQLADPGPPIRPPSRRSPASTQTPRTRRNLFRVHWHNAADRRTRAQVPSHVVLPSSLTGVDARIVVALGDRFPMIASHKVLAAYACLAPRIVTGQFDPTGMRAVWPSTGNYCRGGVAICRIMGCRGVAVLPEGMSQERFDWLERWVADPADIIRTPGTESNVKEIYDRCAELDARARSNVIFNQFSEFGNHLVHYLVTGRALGRVRRVACRTPSRLAAVLRSCPPPARPARSARATRLKERFGTRIVAVEALECPTMLENGFGEHNIQGIGDKHIPLIHNVMNTDFVVGISDRATDRLNVLFNTTVGRDYLSIGTACRPRSSRRSSSFGLSSICNVLAAIKLAAPCRSRARRRDHHRRHRRRADVRAPSATSVIARDFGGTFDAPTPARSSARTSLRRRRPTTLLELTDADRRRIFNLGYYTWVEQQGVPIDEFVARREPVVLDATCARPDAASGTR